MKNGGLRAICSRILIETVVQIYEIRKRLKPHEYWRLRSCLQTPKPPALSRFHGIINS